MPPLEADARRTDLPARLAGLRGWRRSLAAVAAGILLALALPPLFILPAALAAFTALAWLIDGAASRHRAFLDGWLFGCGFSAAGLHWIANSLLVDADRFGWLYPFAVIAIAAGFGLFPACAALGAALAPRGPARTLSLGICWLLLEWVRTWLLTGFPWNPVGSALSFSDALIQPAAWGGSWLLGALVLAAALAPAMAAHGARLTPRRAGCGLAAAITIMAATWMAGTVRLPSEPVADGTVIRLVQPAIDQAQKWRSSRFDEHFAAHVALSSLRPAGPAPAAIVWPEAAVPYALLREQATLVELAATAPEDGVMLVGAVRAEPDREGRLQPRNSLLAFDRSGLLGVYDKRHLVPFGEYVPLRGLLPIGRLTGQGADFAAGSGPSIMRVGAVPPFGALICYEVIFPAEVTGAEGRPAWLLNITNDGWFGKSSGPWQHFQAARQRAVEQGLPLVRAANTGISGVIDPYGRVVASLPLGHRGVLDIGLPEPLPRPTLYARTGDLALLFVLLPAVAALAWFLRRRGQG